MGANRSQKALYFEKLKQLIVKYRELSFYCFRDTHQLMSLNQPLFSSSMLTTLAPTKCIRSA